MTNSFKTATVYWLFFVIGNLSSCWHGAPYIPPTTTIPNKWTISTPKAPPANTSHWWRDFHDPLLTELIEQDALFNLDYKMAQARIETAKEEYKVAFAQLFPVLNANILPPNGTGFDLTQVMALSASIEPDLFGKQWANRQRVRANVKVVEAERDFAIQVLEAEIASSYLDLREAQTKLRVLNHNLKNNRELLQVLKSRYQSGFTNYMSIAQQEGLIETQLAEMEQNKALVLMLIHKIELLTGKNPGLLTKSLLPYKPIPFLTQKINLGIPAELLHRRPDIIAASERVAGAHANIHIAMANLFPQINIGWLLGWQTQTLASALYSMQQPESTFFGTLNSPLFNLNLYRMVDVRKREKISAVINYQMVVMRALHEVETQYNFYTHYKLSADHLKRALEGKRLILKLAKDNYQKGRADFNTLLKEEEDVNRLELTYLHGVVMYQQANINLYKALGGGPWETSSRTQ